MIRARNKELLPSCKKVTDLIIQKDPNRHTQRVGKQQPKFLSRFSTNTLYYRSELKAEADYRRLNSGKAAQETSQQEDYMAKTFQSVGIKKATDSEYKRQQSEQNMIEGSQDLGATIKDQATAIAQSSVQSQ